MLEIFWYIPEHTSNNLPKFQSDWSTLSELNEHMLISKTHQNSHIGRSFSSHNISQNLYKPLKLSRHVDVLCTHSPWFYPNFKCAHSGLMGRGSKISPKFVIFPYQTIHAGLIYPLRHDNLLEKSDKIRTCVLIVYLRVCEVSEL